MNTVSNSQRLLVVDDEEALVTLLKRYLERLSYQVDVCIGAQQALDLIDADPSRYALVVSDLTLPGISGEVLIQKARELNPAIQGVLTSGYPYHSRDPKIEFLQKPFLPKVLSDLIEKMLKTHGA